MTDPTTKALGPAGAQQAGLCPECKGAGKVNWTDRNGDVKERVCPRCHGKGTAGYLTK
jgi:DnaJ-class molecular chaperone